MNYKKYLDFTITSDYCSITKIRLKSIVLILIFICSCTSKKQLQLNDEVDINCVYFDHDKKRLQYKMEMIHKEKKFLASTIEILALYVDLNERKVAEFEDEKIKLMDDFINKNKSKFSNENLKFSSKLKK